MDRRARLQVALWLNAGLAEAQAVAGRVRQELADRFGIVHATLELECDRCVAADSDPCAISSR